MRNCRAGRLVFTASSFAQVVLKSVINKLTFSWLPSGEVGKEVKTCSQSVTQLQLIFSKAILNRYGISIFARFRNTDTPPEEEEETLYNTSWRTDSLVITLIALFHTNGQDMDHICPSPFFTPNATV